MEAAVMSNSIKIVMKDLSIVREGVDYFEKYSVNNFSSEFMANADGGVYSVTAEETQNADDLFKVLCGIKNQKSGSYSIKLDAGGDCSKVIFIPAINSSIPWLNVIDNIKLCGKGNLGLPDNNLLQQALLLAGLEGYEKHIPHRKSVGFRIRIAIARALSFAPKVLFIADFLSKVDNQTKQELLDILETISKEMKIAIFISTPQNVSINSKGSFKL